MAAIRFGDFELDVRAYVLRRNGRPIRLERIPMELLILLVDHPGEMITRERIVEKVWGAGVFLDTNNAINGAIRKLRQALKDDSENPRFIATVMGKGYRFVAPIAGETSGPSEARGAEDRPEPGRPSEPEPGPAPTGTAGCAPEPHASGLEVPAMDAAVAPEAPTPVAAPTIDTRRLVPSGRWWLVVLAGVVATGAAVLSFYRIPSTAAFSRSEERVMLAVLPLENLTGDAGQDYFADGLTEEMISRLGNLDPGRLGVIARTSVMSYRGARPGLPEVGRQLGVQYVLEGSVRRDSGRVRIAAQLIRVADQTHVWARQYERQQSNILEVQAEIAQEVADQIARTFDDARRAPPAPPRLSDADFEAYEHYLKGRFFWNKRTREGFEQSIEAFERAISENPREARAYAGLADAYTLMANYGYGPAAELVPKAREAALRSLQIDEGLAAAHASLALIEEFHGLDWKESERRFRRAIELDPNYATAHHWYAECLAFQGRFDEARAEIDRARELDPLAIIIGVDRGVILYYARDYERAIEQFRSVLAMDPTFGRAYIISSAFAVTGRYAEALAALDDWSKSYQGPHLWAARVYVYGRAGRLPEMRQAERKLEESNRVEHMEPYASCSPAHLALGEIDETMACLQAACRRDPSSLINAKVEPMYDPLRGDPRFQDVVRCAHLAP